MQNALGSLDPHQSVVSILEEPLRLLFHMGAEKRKQRCLELLDMARLERDTLRGRMNSPADSKNGCVLPALWPPSHNTLSLTSLSADWMSH